jgi:hypothetical protein
VTDSPEEDTRPGPESLGALAAQLADLRGSLRTLRAQVDKAGLDGALSLARRVAELGSAVVDLQDDGGPGGPAAPYWLDLDPDEYTGQLAALTEWVTAVLEPGYAAGLPRCWPAHLDAIWELSTLHAEWRRIYDRKRPDLAAALAWNDRWLPGVVKRLGESLRECSRSGCTKTRKVPNVRRI